MDKIDVHNSEDQYEKSLKKLEGEKDISSKNKKIILEFLEASAIGRTAKRNASKKQVGLRAK